MAASVGESGWYIGMFDFIYKFRTMQQIIALYRKNALVAWRNIAATLLRLLAPLFFLILALVIYYATQANNNITTQYQETMNPIATAILPIPSCHSDMYIGPSQSCIELVYSPNTSSVAQTLINNIISSNSIAISARGFYSIDDANAFLLPTINYAIAGVHFIFESGALAGYIVQTNTTSKFFKGNYQDPNLFVQMPLQSAVQREISKMVLTESGGLLASYASSLTWDVSLVPFAHPQLNDQSIVGLILGPFIFAACMFNFVIGVSLLVAEKEQGLRQALRTMGMSDTAYWTSWMLWEITQGFLGAHLMTIFGLMLQFDLFLNNSYGLLFFLFFLFQLAMSSMALVIAVFIRKVAVAVYIGFAIFIVGWIMQSAVLFGLPYSPDYYNEAGSIITIIFSIFPWDLLAKGFTDLGDATVTSSYPGIRWSQRNSYCQNIQDVAMQPPYNPNQIYIDYNCVMSLELIYIIFTILWAGFFVLAVYLDNIWPNESGVRRGFFYFLTKSYWVKTNTSADAALAQAAAKAGKDVGPPPLTTEADDDVFDEEQRMNALLAYRTGSGNQPAPAGVPLDAAVEIYGLRKMFPSNRNSCAACCNSCCTCCCKPSAKNAFWSIANSNFLIEQNQLFCLLGPNGAGKTTTINCLTGVLPPSAGEMLVYGEPIANGGGGLDRVRAKMGVCPQFDVLWGELSGSEHLWLYGHIKGIYWQKVIQDSDSLMARVKLTQATKMRTSSYSGGMKRRLSVAIALLGDPKVVYLDEPTTGMDPITRRHVWDIIQEAKADRAIVLTTHSMEEADILGDRIAIMARGRLRCIGSALHLKQKFGAGYRIAVSVNSSTGSVQDLTSLPARTEGIKEYFMQQLGVAPTEEDRAYLTFVVERSKEQLLAGFLAGLDKRRVELGVVDVQLSLTTLEEVFLAIAKNAEMEAMNASGVKNQEYPLPDGTFLYVPLGAEWVQHPRTQITYQIKWAQDDVGRLMISEVKPLEPGTVPPAAPPILQAMNSRRSRDVATVPSAGTEQSQTLQSQASYKSRNDLVPPIM